MRGNDAATDLQWGPIEAEGLQEPRATEGDDLGKLALEIAQIYAQRASRSTGSDDQLSLGIPGRKTKRPVRWSFIVVVLVAAVSMLGSVLLFTGHGSSPPSTNSSVTRIGRSDLGDKTVSGSQVARSSHPPGSLFAFSGAGSAQSTSIQASSTFVVDWEVSCPMGSQGATVDLELLSGQDPALLLPIQVGANPQQRGTSPELPAGSYSVQAAAPSPCTWSVVAEAKARS